MRVTIDKDLAAWIDARVQTGYFGSYSHAINWGLYRLKQAVAKAESAVEVRGRRSGWGTMSKPKEPRLIKRGDLYMVNGVKIGEITDEKLVNAIWSVHLDDGGRMEYRFSRKDGKPVLEIYGDELSPSLPMMLGATLAK